MRSDPHNACEESIVLLQVYSDQVKMWKKVCVHLPTASEAMAGKQKHGDSISAILGMNSSAIVRYLRSED